MHLGLQRHKFNSNTTCLILLHIAIGNSHGYSANPVYLWKHVLKQVFNKEVNAQYFWKLFFVMSESLLHQAFCKEGFCNSVRFALHLTMFICWLNALTYSKAVSVPSNTASSITHQPAWHLDMLDLGFEDRV